jgi:endogenous inhibitor of DNA gyrase (YacG/DUF329 family)
MGQPRPTDDLFEVECPHCHKRFQAELLAPESANAGFKCPHCKLFVAYERASETAEDD